MKRILAFATSTDRQYKWISWLRVVSHFHGHGAPAPSSIVRITYFVVVAFQGDATTRKFMLSGKLFYGTCVRWTTTCMKYAKSMPFIMSAEVLAHIILNGSLGESAGGRFALVFNWSSGCWIAMYCIFSRVNSHESPFNYFALSPFRSICITIACMR